MLLTDFVIRDHGLEDSIEYTKIEYAYYKMALEAGIEMNECRLLTENGRNHFMTKRFDRKNDRKIHMQTLAAIGHIDYNVPGLCSYEQAANYMQEMNLGNDEIQKLFRRMVFNVVAVNQDDHVKNISFLMDRNGIWRLAPAYDMTFAYDPDNQWLKAHQMTINGKSRGISREDVLTTGINMGISRAVSNSIIDEAEHAVNNWTIHAEHAGIRENTYEMIQNIIDESSL